MCIHEIEGLTRKERLMEMEAVRRHHEELRLNAYASSAGERAYWDHVRQHRADAARRKEARGK